MLKDFLKLFRNKNKEVQTEPITQETKPRLDAIIFSEENGFYKIIIKDFLTISEFMEIDKNIDKDYILDLLGTSILWNSRFTSTNKGTIYAKEDNNRIFNILLSDNEIQIKEKAKMFIDEDEKKDVINSFVEPPKNLDYVIYERTLSFYKNNGKIHFAFLRHTPGGDTYSVRIYDNGENIGMPKLQLTTEEAYEGINYLLNNLKGLDNIDTILDISLLERLVSKKEEIKKVIEIDNKTYNIEINNGIIKINIRSKEIIDDNEKKIINEGYGYTKDNLGDYVIYDKTIEFNRYNNSYNYSHLRHMDNDTYYLKSYRKDNQRVSNFGFDDENEVYEEINNILNNLDSIDEINTLLDINLLRENILNDIKNKSK